MLRQLVYALSALLFFGGEASAFEVKATIKRIDVQNKVLFFHAVGIDRTASVGADASIVDAQGKRLPDGLGSKELSAGTVVTLSIERVENRPVIRAIRLGAQNSAETAKASPTRDPATVEKQDTSKLVPLTDLGRAEYQGFPGGLYPDGSNIRPHAHDAAGRRLAKLIRPIDARGQPSADGRIVLLGIGFSNTVQAFQGFMQVAEEDKHINTKLVLVNGAVGGMSAAMIQTADEGRGKMYWDTVDERLKAAGVRREQVQVVWIKETNPAPHNGGYPAYVRDLEAQLAKIVQLVSRRFPNVKLAYFSSRTYGGWAKRRPNGSPPGNSEPFSYESGFAVKWLIERQLKGDPALSYAKAGGGARASAPWLSWGPYLWSNGPIPRSDGVGFELEDFRVDDRMHESPAGQRKVGKLLLEFFKTDPTTKEWFLRDAATADSPADVKR
jgi:hypothetical protein